MQARTYLFDSALKVPIPLVPRTVKTYVLPNLPRWQVIDVFSFHWKFSKPAKILALIKSAQSTPPHNLVTGTSALRNVTAACQPCSNFKPACSPTSL